MAALRPTLLFLALWFGLPLAQTGNAQAQAPSTNAELLPAPVRPWAKSLGGNDHHYQAVAATDGILWKDAQAWAVAHGGYLATIGTTEENDFVFKLIDSPRYWGVGGPYGTGPFLGGANTASKPGWQWANNEGAFAFTKWAPDQPNNNEAEQRLQFISDGKGAKRMRLWNDLPAANKQYGFVVEYANPAQAAPDSPTNPPLDQLFAVRFALLEAQGEMQQSTDNRGSFRKKSMDDIDAAVAKISLGLKYLRTHPEEAKLPVTVPPLFESTRTLLNRPINKNQTRPIKAITALKTALDLLQNIPGNAGGHRQAILQAIQLTATDIQAGANYLDNFADK
jgi:hypothetical protein